MIIQTQENMDTLITFHIKPVTHTAFLYRIIFFHCISSYWCMSDTFKLSQPDLHASVFSSNELLSLISGYPFLIILSQFHKTTIYNHKI